MPTRPTPQHNGADKDKRHRQRQQTKGTRRPKRQMAEVKKERQRRLLHCEIRTPCMRVLHVHAFIIVSNWTVQCVATNHVDSYENPNPINIDDEPVTQQHTHNDNVPNREDLHWRQAQLAAPLFSTQGTFPSYTTFAFHLAGSPYKDSGA